MISLVTAFRELIQLESSPQLILTVFNDKNYLTPVFMRHADKETSAVIQLIDKMAFLGLNLTKRLLLKGYNFRFKRNFQAFNDFDEAIHYLADETKHDRDVSAFFKNMRWP